MKCDLAGIRACVFDVDDTVYLERDYVKSGFNAVGEYIETLTGNPYFGETCWTIFQSGVRGDVFDRALRSLQIKDDLASVSRLVNLYRSHTPAIFCEESIIQVLKQLKNNFDLSVITGGPLEPQRHKVSALGLESLCDRVVFSGMYGPLLDKPHPWSWKEIEKRTGFLRSELIYFGDNPSKDFDAPLKLGWRTMRVRQQNSLHETRPTPSGIPECKTLLEGIYSITGDLSI